MLKSTKIHWKATKQTLHYLIDIKEIGLIYGEKPLNTDLYGYMNSNFAVDKDNRYSISGYLFKLNGACIHWQSKQQSLITRSMHEAEYVGMVITSYKFFYLRKLL